MEMVGAEQFMDFMDAFTGLDFSCPVLVVTLTNARNMNMTSLYIRKSCFVKEYIFLGVICWGLLASKGHGLNKHARIIFFC